MFFLLTKTGEAGSTATRKIAWSVWHVSQNPYPIYDQDLQFSLPYLRPDQKFNTLSKTVAAGAVTLNIIYARRLMIFVIIMKKK